MPFCNSCGAETTGLTNFCPKCGARVMASAGAATTNAAAPVAVPVASRGQGMGTGLKVLLVVVGLIFVMGIVFIIGIASFVHHVKVSNINGRSQVVTPFGTVNSTQDANAVMRQAGLPVYPGSSPLNGSDVNAMGRHVMSAQYSTSDSPQQVGSFYAEKFPGATFTTNGNTASVMVMQSNRIITISAHSMGGQTRIELSSVTH
jgi:hypothetical protein